MEAKSSNVRLQHKRSQHKVLSCSNHVQKKNKKEINQIKINGRRIIGIQNLKEEVRQFFAKRFAQEATPEFDFNMENHPKLSDAQARNLETIPSREEIEKAV